VDSASGKRVDTATKPLGSYVAATPKGLEITTVTRHGLQHGFALCPAGHSVGKPCRENYVA